MLKFDDFRQNAGGLVFFPPFSFPPFSSSSKYEPLIKSIIFLYSPYPFLFHIHFHLIPFNKGGLIGPALLGARLYPPPPSSFLLPPPSMDFCVCSYLVHLVHIKSLYEVVRILVGPVLLGARLSPPSFLLLRV